MSQDCQDEPPGDDDAEKNPPDARKIKAPNKKKFEGEIEALKHEIQKKESELKSLQSSLQKEEGLQGEQKTMRAKKSSSTEQRNRIDTDLRALTQEITKKKDSLSRLEVNLTYKSESRVDEAIRRLETQLKLHNYKLIEEKKIVSEINTLKRSKKVLSQYLAAKKELDEMKIRQKQYKDKRDTVFKEIMKLKNAEEDIRRKTVTTRQQADALKQEINALYDQKRQLVADYKKHEIQFYAIRKELWKRQKDEHTKRKEEEKEAKHREQLEIKKTMEPFLHERQTCSALVLYLQRHVPSEPTDDQPSTSSASSEPVQQLEDGLFLLKKKEEDMLMYPCLGKSRNTRKRKDKRKVSQLKYLAHTPETLSQFQSLNLHAPSNLAEIQASIEQLRARQLFYEEEAEKVKQTNAVLSTNEESATYQVDSGVHISCDSNANDDLGRGLSICESESSKSDTVDENATTEDSILVSDSEEHKKDFEINQTDREKWSLAGECDHTMPKMLSNLEGEFLNGDGDFHGDKTTSEDEDLCAVAHIKARLKDRDIEQIQHIMEGLHTQELIHEAPMS